MKIKALLVKPLELPEVVEIENKLSVLQSIVGGYIQVVYPFPEPVGIICNDDGKLIGLPLNRSLRDENGKIYDILAGDFLVVGLNEDDFCSLSDELINQFKDKFSTLEYFCL